VPPDSSIRVLVTLALFKALIGASWAPFLNIETNEESTGVQTPEVGVKDLSRSDIVKWLDKPTNLKKIPSCLISTNSHKRKITPTPNLNSPRVKKSSLSNAADSEVTMTETAKENINSDSFNGLVNENKLLKEEIKFLKDQLASLNSTGRHDISAHSDREQDNNKVFPKDSELSSDNEISFIKHLKRKNKSKKRTSTILTQKKTTPSNLVTGNLSQRPRGREEITSSRTIYKERPPPINILHQDPKDTVNLLKSEFNITKFYVKRLNNNKHTVQLESLDDFNKTKEILQKVKTNFYSYTAKSEKVHSFLLKGLNCTFSDKEVFDELQALNIQDLQFLKVSRFYTKKSSINNKTLPFFIVQLSPKSNLNKLKEIKFVCHHVVFWEKLKKRDIMQCKKCQRLGHAAINCNLQYRCVKCNAEHKPGDCKITSIQGVPDLPNNGLRVNS